MRTTAVTLLALTCLSLGLPLSPAKATPASSTLDPNRIVVGFWSDVPANALYISSRYNVPIVFENDVLQYAVFRPPNNPNAFLKVVKGEPVVRYAEPDLLACVLAIGCGGGGGGGGGTPPPTSALQLQHLLPLGQAPRALPVSL